MKDITPTQLKQYMDSGAQHCPICESNNITTTGSISNDEVVAWQPVRCIDCSTTWQDEYKMHDVTIKSRPAQPESKQGIYDELSRVLTDHEGNGGSSVVGDDVQIMYDMLTKIQNEWDCTITANCD